MPQSHPPTHTITLGNNLGTTHGGEDCQGLSPGGSMWICRPPMGMLGGPMSDPPFPPGFLSLGPHSVCLCLSPRRPVLYPGGGFLWLLCQQSQNQGVPGHHRAQVGRGEWRGWCPHGDPWACLPPCPSHSWCSCAIGWSRTARPAVGPALSLCPHLPAPLALISGLYLDTALQLKP